MTDYGHHLEFGVFVTPTSADPQRPVDLAVTADRAGLDLVTVQDHPYQPKLLDAWTLLSFIGARTERVRLSGNVLNLPLRPPAVLARAAAGLDLLTGGRVDMTIGAGGFYHAIAAMGGPDRSPGQARRGLDEAITVMREIWDTSTRSGVHVRGEIYTVDGAKRGPAPAHPIPISVGAYKPRMLELIGRRCDGWVPSLGYLPGGVADLDAMNARIDDAAVAADREPSAVRRMLNLGGVFATGEGLLNGPPDALPAEIAEAATRYGVSTFVFATDDADEITHLGAEIAPAARELVARARG